jgi:hypothetical protein
MSTIPAPASTAEAVDMYLTSLRYLAATDPTALAVQAQAECLQALEQGDAMSIAARGRILAAFTAGQGYSADADYSATSWLIHRTGITKGAARGHRAWARRAVTHPRMVAALAEGAELTESMARAICGWTDKLPASCWDAADEILIGAARGGASQGDLASLAAEIYARSLPDAPDDDLLPNFEDRRGGGPASEERVIHLNYPAGDPLPHAWIEDEDGHRHPVKDLLAPGRFLLIARGRRPRQAARRGGLASRSTRCASATSTATCTTRAAPGSATARSPATARSWSARTALAMAASCSLATFTLALGQLGLGLFGLRLGPGGFRLGPCLRLGPGGLRRRLAPGMFAHDPLLASEPQRAHLLGPGP